jgi:uncharacterized protein
MSQTAKEDDTRTRTAKRKSQAIRYVLWAVAALGVIGLFCLYGVTVYFIQTAFSHRVEKFVYRPPDLALDGTSVELTSSDGIPLKAWWIRASPAHGAVILLHGMDGLDASCLLPHAKFLFEAGWSSFVLDMRAHGRSGGGRIGLSLEEPRDVSAALDWVGRQAAVRDGPLVLLGLSMGGATAIRTAAARPDVDAVISVRAFASFERMMGEGLLQLWLGRLGILTLYRIWSPAAQPVRDIARISPRPILLIHGAADRQIPVSNAYLLKQAAASNAELWLVDGADHLVFTQDGIGPADRAYRERILDFLGRIRHESALKHVQQPTR